MTKHSPTLPGDIPHHRLLEEVIRVDQAGEYGAKRIYQGQMDFIKDPAAKKLIAHMAQQEETHLAHFNQLMRQHRVRPTLLTPLWHVAGYALGAATAMMGKEAAMACTVAVESVIDEHYAAQQHALGSTEPELVQSIEAFRQEEMEHHNTGLAQGAEEAPAYPVLSTAIKGATRLAIWLSRRI